MQVGVCQPVKPFNFYPLEQFQHQQLISRSKYFVGSYIHRETKLQYVVKEIPYDEQKIQLLRKLDKIGHNNITPLLGVSLHKSRGTVNERLKENSSSRDNLTLLLFMEKYEMSLHQYVVQRRKKQQPFNKQQINSFVGQIMSALQRLQCSNLAHRDVKPQNILYNKGTYLLCDFDDIMTVSTQQKPVVDLTTVQYSSPSFLKHIRHRRPKEKYFDPFKLDVYALGLTLLYMCSMGRFSLQGRSSYIYESSQHSHADFIKEERRKWIVKNSEYKTFNSLIKMMLEEDEYKRDDFVTLTIKNKVKGQTDRAYSDYNKSEDKSSKKGAQVNKKAKKMLKAKREEEMQRRESKIYGGMTLLTFGLFILLCLL